MNVSLSIVIPAFNEAARLPASLRLLARHTATRPGSVEVLVADDGSGDGTARLLDAGQPLAAELASLAPRTRWATLRLPHRGKGHAVRQGMLAARGHRLLFTDADLSAPIPELAKLEAALDAGADLAAGSRACRALLTTRQSWRRECAGRAFNALTRLALGLHLRDTQCGFKLFTRPCAQTLFTAQQVTGWGFDPELLFLARRLGFRVAEVPVVWGHAEGAKIHLLRDSCRMFADLASIRARAARGLYPSPARARREAA